MEGQASDNQNIPLDDLPPFKPIVDQLPTGLDISQCNYWEHNQNIPGVGTNTPIERSIIVDPNIEKMMASKLLPSGAQRIVNGNNVDDAARWPFIVRALFESQEGGWSCGGSLIDYNFILTAAHCCSGADSVNLEFGQKE